MSDTGPLLGGRFSRHRELAEWSEEAQLRLARASVFVAGCGALGGLVAFELAAAGVGTLILCDHGAVELSNLNRQLFYRADECGSPKPRALGRRIHAFAPDTLLSEVNLEIGSDNAIALTDGATVVVDCLDSDVPRSAINRAALEHQLPLVHGGVRGWSGEAAILCGLQRACFACLRSPTSPAPNQEIPVIAPAAAIVASLQAHLAIRLLAGLDEMATTTLYLWSGSHQLLRPIAYPRNPQCAVCSQYHTTGR